MFYYLNHHQQKVSKFFEWWIEHTYAPVVKAAVKYRYVTVAIAVAILIAVLGYIRGGHIRFTFMPKVDTHIVTTNIVLKPYVGVAQTREAMNKVAQAAWRVIDKHGGRKIVRGFMTQLGKGLVFGHGGAVPPPQGANTASVQIFFVDPDKRSFTAEQFANWWRREIGDIADLESITMKYNAGPQGGAAIDIQLAHNNLHVLKEAGEELAAAIAKYSGTYDVNDGWEPGRPEVDLKLNDQGAVFGLNAMLLSQQVRGGVYGAESLREQRGEDELRVMIRLPQNERQSISDVEDMLLQGSSLGGMSVDTSMLPGAGFTGGLSGVGSSLQGTVSQPTLTLRSISHIIHTTAPTTIHRTDGRRTIDVTADVDPALNDPNRIREELARTFIPKLKAKYPGLEVSTEGEQRNMKESMQSLRHLFVIAMILIFALLAVPLRSYVQPIIVMTAIPFGLIGAWAGHMLMGFNLSIISMMGIVALSGVVVNDSLLLVDTSNRFKAEGMSSFDAAVQAGIRRFRPVFLTSITTFFGLTPMIFETSIQARILIPMALSLGYGVLFATFITLLVVPAQVAILDDIKRLFTRSEK